MHRTPWVAALALACVVPIGALAQGASPVAEAPAEVPAAASEPVPAPEALAPAPAEPAAAAEPSPEADAPPAALAAAQERRDHEKFIKGDLVHVGTRRLLSRFDHVGVSTGATVIDSDAFLTVTPGLAFYKGDLAFSLGVPLNLLAFEGGTRELGSFRIRHQDWDEIADFARVIRFITWGRKEENLYFTINSLRPATIGHGLLMNNYQPNADVDRQLTGLAFDAHNDWAGFQLQANDVTFQNRVLGALVFLKPLGFLSEESLARSLSIGLEWVGDLAAPRCLRVSSTSEECVQGSGHRAGWDPFSSENLDRTFLRTDPVTGRAAVQTAMAHAVGVSAEIKVLKEADTADVKLYGTYHSFLNEGGGGGAAAGFLGRFNLGGPTWTNAFRIRGEYRNFGDGFLPAYFDSLYEIQKYSLLQALPTFQVTPTKYQLVFGDPANGFTRPDFGRVHGYNVDVSWGLFAGGRSGKKLAMGVGLQDSGRPDDTRFHAHLEFPLLEFVQLFGTFMRVNAASTADLFAPGFFSSANTVVLSGLRFKILPILFVNAHYSRSFRVTRSPGSEYHLGNERVVDAAGNPSRWFGNDQLFENVQTLWVELEVGYELGGAKDRQIDYSRLGDPSDQEGH
jgi:hypothetical protein